MEVLRPPTRWVRIRGLTFALVLAQPPPLRCSEYEDSSSIWNFGFSPVAPTLNQLYAPLSCYLGHSCPDGHGVRKGAGLDGTERRGFPHPQLRMVLHFS